MGKVLNITLEEGVKQKLKWKVDDIKGWVAKNKQLIAVLAPIFISGTISVIKIIGRKHNIKGERDLKELYCYDRSLGHYWRIKRNLSNREWLDIDRRKRNGERLSDILSEMRVLK